MAKKQKRLGLKHHIKHKSRLTLLLATKILLAFVCFYIAFAIFSYAQEIIGTVLALAASMVVLFVLYLFFLIRVLRLFKFR